MLFSVMYIFLLLYTLTESIDEHLHNLGPLSIYMCCKGGFKLGIVIEDVFAI
jgi:hypothetical protein